MAASCISWSVVMLAQRECACLSSKRFLQEEVFPFGLARIQHKVRAAGHQAGHFQRRAARKPPEIEAVQQVFADLQFLLELGVGHLGDVHVAIVGLVPLGVFPSWRP